MSKPSPGPWKAERGQGAKTALLIRAANGKTVGMIFEKDAVLQNDGEAFANADQAAAAPELRQALRAMVSSKNFDQFETAAAQAFEVLDRLDAREGARP